MILKVKAGYEDVPVVPSRGPAMLAPLFLGSMPPHKLLPEELCHALLSLVCRQGGNNLFLLIALWHEFEWLSGQLKNRFAVKTEIL